MNAPRHSQPTVPVIIPVFNKWEYTRQCLQPLGENATDVDHEVIVIDNGSSDGTGAGMAAWPYVNVRYQRNAENLGFARAVNQGARLARGRYLMFLNNDTEPQRGWLSAMVKVAEGNPRVAIVGCKLLFPDGTIQHGGVVFAYAAPEPLTPFHFDYRKPADTRNRTLDLRAVTAACMLIRTEVFSSVGGLDEAFVNGYEDVDLCLKVWSAGGKIIYTPDAVVTHHESVQVDLTFSPQAPPWYRDISKLHRFLLIPDWESPVWRETVAAYLRAFSAADPVALIMRVEPPSTEWMDAAWGAVNGLLAELAMSPDRSADIVFEGTQRPDSERGGLYTSATAYIRCSPTDSRDYARQAAACGLPVLTAPDVEQLRHWVARR